MVVRPLSVERGRERQRAEVTSAALQVRQSVTCLKGYYWSLLSTLRLPRSLARQTSTDLRAKYDFVDGTSF